MSQKKMLQYRNLKEESNENSKSEKCLQLAIDHWYTGFLPTDYVFDVTRAIAFLSSRKRLWLEQAA